MPSLDTVLCMMNFLTKKYSKKLSQQKRSTLNPFEEEQDFDVDEFEEPADDEPVYQEIPENRMF